jgi:hypothetical protein
LACSGALHSSTFKATPDVPFNTFELTLPQGPFSALTANGDLCKQVKTTTRRLRVAIHRHGHIVHVIRKVKRTVAAPLLMPTSFVAQNGAQLRQATKISVSGCPTAKKGAKVTRKGAKRRGKRG